MKSVFVTSGMRRGGSTLQFQLVCDILQAAGIPFDSHWAREIGDADLAPAEGSAVRVVKTHAVPACALPALSAAHVQCFYIRRDPRDALVSYLAKYEADYSDERAARFLHTIHREFLFWSGLPGAHCVRYEEVVGALAEEIARCAATMGVPLAPDEAERIAASRSVESQRRRIEEFDWDASAMRIGKDLVDPETQLHSNHIRSGGSGGWRNELAAGAVLFLEARLGRCIEDMGYGLTTSRWRRWRHRFGAPAFR